MELNKVKIDVKNATLFMELKMFPQFNLPAKQVFIAYFLQITVLHRLLTIANRCSKTQQINRHCNYRSI